MFTVRMRFTLWKQIGEMTMINKETIRGLQHGGQFTVRGPRRLGLPSGVPACAAAIGLAFAGLIASADATVYVAPGGSDNSADGRNPATPFATLAHAVGEASWGEKVSLAAGTYTECGIVIDKNLEICGAGAGSTLIQGDALPCAAPDRVFKIELGICARIADLEIARGYSQKPGDTNGGGCLNAGELELQNVRFTDCDAGPEGYGGGCYNAEGANLNMYNCCMDSCDAGDGIHSMDVPGTSGGGGGGVANFGAFHANRLTISNCSAGDGGDGAGGGGNGGNGGALENMGVAACHCFTASGNWAGSGGDNITGSFGGFGGSGGACNSTGKPLELVHCTLIGNAAGAGGSGGGPGCGGGCHDASGTNSVCLTRCILANNTVAPGGCGADIGGNHKTLGGNVVEDTDFFSLVGTGTGDVVGQEPAIGALSDSGGLCPTHPLPAGSICIDRGAVDLLGKPLIDARGYSRDSMVDSGAYEAGGAPLADLDMDSIPDIVDADKDGDGMDDSWETDNGLDPGDPSDGATDKDGDGFSNFNESRFCTDPCDSGKHIRLAIERVTGGVKITLSPTFPNKKYTLRISKTGRRWDGVPGSLNLETVDPALIFADGFESGDTSAWSSTVGP